MLDRPSTEGLWPTWRYWAGVLLAVPALLMLATYGWALAESGLPEPVLLAPACLVLVTAGALILRERRVRAMSGSQKATWAFIGLVLALTVWFAVVASVAVVDLTFGCIAEAGCFD